MGSMQLKSWRTSKARVRESKAHGYGLFAVKLIKKGEVVAIKGGHIVDKKTLLKLEGIIDDSELQITKNFFLAPLRKSEREGVMMFLNHSCSPNIGVQGNIVFVAMRNIRVGAELTVDYAMIDDMPYRMRCNCEAKNCRKIITGRDWRRPELQKRYRGYFSTFIQTKITRAKEEGR